MYLIQVLVGAVVFGLTLWGGIKLVDRYNTHNSIPLALIIGVVFAAMAPMFGAVLIVLPLIALLYLLINFFNLGLLQSLAVFIAMGAMNLALGEVIRLLQ